MGDQPARIGYLGGTFDPVHVGHLISARELADALRLDRVVWLPAKQPPHKAGRTVSALTDRVAMLELAIADEPDFAIDLRETRRDGPSYTFDTLSALRDERPDDERFFLIGADSLAQLHTWYRAAELPSLAQFATAVRPGTTIGDLAELGAIITDAQIRSIREHCVPTTPIGVSSTAIRRRVADGLSIRHRVPAAVEAHIRRRGLYTDATSARDCS